MIEEVAIAYTHSIWNEKDLTAVDRWVDKFAIIHSSLGELSGPDELKKNVITWFTGFPDLVVHPLHILIQGDVVALHWKAEGTHQGFFKGYAPTGKKIEYKGVTLYKIQNTKIVEYWAYVDMAHIIQQIQ